MGAGSELRAAVSGRLVPLLADLEEVVYRYGHLRVFAAAIAALGSIGLLGQVLGLLWLRTTFATATGVLFTTAALVSFAGTQKLRNHTRGIEKLLHGYLDELPKTTPIAVRDLKQAIIIENNGDAWIRREVTMAESREHHRRYLALAITYYGQAKYTERDKRRVEYTVRHASSSAPEDGVRVPATSAWTLTSQDQPRLTVYAHLGRTVEEGDVVTIDWHWPRYSADLMKGGLSESFDTVFTTSVARFEYRVIFRNFKNDSALKVKAPAAIGLTRFREGRDTILRFAGAHPVLGEKFGFTVDIDRDN